jgi:hypothetical protein
MHGDEMAHEMIGGLLVSSNNYAKWHLRTIFQNGIDPSNAWRDEYTLEMIGNNYLIA